MDYINNFLSHADSNLLRLTFEQSCRARETSSEAELDDLLLGQSTEGFWNLVQANLKQERLHVAVIADDVPPDLKRNIAGLNKRWPTITFSAIAVRQHISKDNSMRVIVSEDTAEAQAVPTPSLPKPLTSAPATSIKASGARPTTWEEAVDYMQDPEMRTILLAEARTQRGSVTLRKIYYDVDIMRWRLKIQKSDVNMYQQMRFADDLQRWRKEFPEFANEIRTPEQGSTLSFNIKNSDQLRRPQSPTLKLYISYLAAL